MKTNLVRQPDADPLRSNETETIGCFENMIFASSEMLEVCRYITSVAKLNITVLVTGETGVGKEMVAKAIHNYSARAENNFTIIDCSAIKEEILESELFGHVRGSFSGAIFDRKGLFEEANGGTAFFDEIAEIPLHLQARLLRLIETKEFRLMGANKIKTADVRIIAATKRDLRVLVEKGKFREDLFYRLNRFSIHVPPLRERYADIPVIADHLLKKFSREFGKASVRTSDELAPYLMNLPWKGNVRELENFIQKEIISPSSVLALEGLAKFHSNGNNNGNNFRPISLKEAAVEARRKHIIAARDHFQTLSEAASALKIKTRSLYRYMQELGIKTKE